MAFRLGAKLPRCIGDHLDSWLRFSNYWLLWHSFLAVRQNDFRWWEIGKKSREATHFYLFKSNPTWIVSLCFYMLHFSDNFQTKEIHLSGKWVWWIEFHYKFSLVSDWAEVCGAWPVEGATNCQGCADEAQLQLIVILEATKDTGDNLPLSDPSQLWSFWVGCLWLVDCAFFSRALWCILFWLCREDF